MAVLATELREASDALGYERLLALAADVEDVAGKLRAGKVQPAKPVRDAMAEAAGVMRSLLLAYRDGHLRRRPDTPAHPDRTNAAQAGAETQPPADADQPRPEPAAEPAPETAAGEVATPAVPAVEGGDTELGIPRAPEAAPEPAPDLPAPGTELAQAEPSAAVVDSPVPAETSAATVGSAPGSETELIALPSAPESAAVPSQPDPQPQGAGTFETVAAALSVVEEAATPPAAPVGKATNPPAPATAEDAVA
ncbi:MAG: hypothetical protein IT463_02890, partial [Planctomycetes bacterium]|nr:hypothetical protein [Planctomycetota bacterium]